MGSNTTAGIGQGVSAGAAFGPWGAVIGGVIGGLAGLMGDEKAAKARRYVKKANALRTDATMLRSYAEQRLLLRQAQLAAATSLSNSANSGAEIDSSGAQGLRASIVTQSYDNYLLGQSILNQQLDANFYEAKAGTQLRQSQDIMGMLQLGAQLTSLIPRNTDQNTPRTAKSLNNAFDTTLVTPGGIQTVNSGATYLG